MTKYATGLTHEQAQKLALLAQAKGYGYTIARETEPYEEDLLGNRTLSTLPQRFSFKLGQDQGQGQ